MRRYFNGLTISVAISFSFSVFPAGAKKVIAVVNFQNTSGSSSLDYLKAALPESISGSLASVGEIRIVERNALGKLLKELELEQSGAVDAAEVARAGKLARADILLLGSFSGNAEKITVTLKAVDVATGVVLEGRSIAAPLSEILEQSGQNAIAIAAAVAGGKTGFLTITTNPDATEVRIDGVVAGRTPLVEYKLSAGRHRIFLVKSGFKELDFEVTIGAGATEKISESLVSAQKPSMILIGIGYQRLMPPSGPLKQGNLIVGQIGFTIGKWAFDLSYAINPTWDHSYNYATPFGSLTDSRSYTVNMYLLGVTYTAFDWRYFAPYVGFFAGFTRVTDYELKGADKTSSQIASFDLFQVSGKLGLEIMPRQIFSLFIEGRYHYFPANISRSTKASQGVLGGPTQVPGETNLSGFSVGGGIRMHF